MATANTSPNGGSKREKNKTGTFITLDPEDLEDLKCFTCKKYLSNPPIMLSKDGNYCGDCGDESNKEQLRNKDYEKLAAKFLFPCSFEGCEKKMPFERIGQHQKNCDFRQYKCPLCLEYWRGGRKELKQHIFTKHSSDVLEKGTFILKFSKTYKQTGVLIIEDRFFFVEIDFNIISSEFMLTVEHIGSPVTAGMLRYYLQMVGDKIAKPFCTESKSIVPETTQEIKDKHVTKVTTTDLLTYLKYPASIECRVFIYNKADFADQTRSTSLHTAIPAEGELLDLS